MNAQNRYTVEGSVAAILFFALIAVVLIQVFGRTGLFQGPVWTEELARWIWVWMAFVAVGAAEKRNAQLRMGVLVDIAPRPVRTVIYTAIDIAILALTIHLMRIGYATVLRTWNNEAVTLPFTDALLYASYPVAAVFVIWRVGWRIWDAFRGRDPWTIVHPDADEPVLGTGAPNKRSDGSIK